MKLTKKVFALVMVLAILVGCVSATAFAADENEVATFAGDSTIYVWSATYGRNYNVYQVFYGDQAQSEDVSSSSSNKTLANVKWGVSLYKAGEGGYDYTSNLIDKLKSDDTLKTVFGNITVSGATNDKSVATAVSVILSDQSDNSAVMVAFAQAIADAIGDNEVESRLTLDGTVAAGGGYDAILNNVHTGYYMIVDNSMDNGDDGTSNYNPDGTQNANKDASKYSYSRIMLKVVGSTATANEKVAAVPSLSKAINVSEDHKTAGATSQYDFGSVGETRSFTLTSNVPDMTGYNKYFFILTDTMSKGLTFDDDPAHITVTIGDDTLKEASQRGVDDANNSKWYKLVSETDEDTGITTIQFIFHDFVQYLGRTNDAVVVTYNATINDDANIGTAGDTNTAKITYSNNPNCHYEGKDGNEPWDEDQPNDNETPAEVKDTVDHTVYIYTTGLTLYKIAGGGSGSRLTGAKFRITPKDGTTAVVKTVIEQKETYTATGYVLSTVTEVPDFAENTYLEMSNDAFTPSSSATTLEYLHGAKLVTVKFTATGTPSVTGGYYMKTGTYDNVEDSLVHTDDRDVASLDLVKGYVIYTMDGDGKSTIEVDSTNAETWESEVGDNGMLTLNGLGAGTYYITETASPDGYTILAAPIEVTIGFQVPTVNSTECTWTYTLGSDTSSEVASFKGNNTNEINIINESGKALPETGGIGTTIFYTVGSILVVAAVVLLITKRRMRNVNY
jgi:fimbrial isopeptide formation D2 family protein/LPXTG-motif cell wall-anchored protein